MATNNNIARLARNVRVVDVGSFAIDDKPTLPVVATAGDSVTLFTAPCDMRLYGAHLRQPATVGAGVTLKLQKNSGGTRTDLTASTTAATAGVVSGSGLVPIDLKAGETVEVLVSGGANAAVAIEYDLLVRRA